MPVAQDTAATDHQTMQESADAAPTGQHAATGVEGKHTVQQLDAKQVQQDNAAFADMTRHAAGEDLAYLFGGKLDSVEIIHKHAPVLMRKNEHSPEKEPERLRIAMKFKDDIEPDAAIQQIQETIGNIPGFEIFNKLQPTKTSGEQVKELAQQFGAKDGQGAGGFTTDEVHALMQWADRKDRVEPTVREITDQPHAVHFWLENSAQNTDRVMQVADNLEARAEAMRAAVVEKASQLIATSNTPDMAELLMDLQNLQVQVSHTHTGEFGSVNVKFGLPGKPDPQNEDKTPEMVPSKALEWLMTQHSEQDKQSSMGENLLRYATTFVGENWAAAFPHVAGHKEMQQYLEDRAAESGNKELSAKVAEIVKDNDFLTPMQREEKMHSHPDANFRITTPGFHGHDDYRVDLALPDGVKPEQIYGGIAQAAGAKKEKDKAELVAKAQHSVQEPQAAGHGEPPTKFDNPQAQQLALSAPGMRL